MDETDIPRALSALNRNTPRGWRALGIIPSKQEIDYVNPKGKHKTYGYIEIENGLRVLGGRSGPVDVEYES